MDYSFSEGSVKVPDSLKDRTLHVLVPAGQGAGFTLVIGRDELEPGETPLEFLQRSLADLSRQVTKYEESGRESIGLGAADLNIRGVRLDLKYKQRGQFLFVMQGVFLMPDQKTVSTFSATSSTPFDQTQRSMWNEIIASFRPRPSYTA
jgi:hypothetical protein